MKQDVLQSIPDPDELSVPDLLRLPKCDWLGFARALDETFADDDGHWISPLDEEVLGAVRSLCASSDPDTAAAARIWIAMRAVEVALAEGGVPDSLDDLLVSLQSGFIDVTGAAVSLCSLLLIASDVEAFRYKGHAYAEIARELGEPVALVDAAEELAEGGDSDGALVLFERALEALDGPISGNLYFGTPIRAMRGQAWCQAEAEPDVVRAWFRTTQDALPLESLDAWNELGPTLAIEGYFNVESGRAGVAPRIFGALGSAGRGIGERQIDGSFSVTSGDGVYPVVSVSDGEGVSAIALLQQESDDPSASLPLIVYTAAPLILGEFRSERFIFFADAEMSFNAPYVALDVDAGGPDDYLVVAWVARSPLFGSLRPAAIGALSGTFARILFDSLPPVSDEDQRELIRLIWGNPALPVTVHTQDMALQAVASNLELERGRDIVSWVVLLAECFDDDGDEARAALSGEPLALDDALSDELECRGLRTLSLAWWSPTGHPESDALCGAIIAARDPATPATQLSVLARHSSRWVRRNVAGRDDLSHQTLAGLALDEDAAVRALAASNQLMPATALVNLSTDPSTDVRGAVAANPATPPETLNEIAVRGEFLPAVAGNPSTYPQTRALIEPELVALGLNDFHDAGDYEDDEVDLDIDAYLEEAGMWVDIELEEESIREIVARNPSCPPELLFELAKDEDCRFNVADNTSCPKDLIRDLADDEDCHIALARNPVCPPELLLRLADTLSAVDRAIQLASNPACPAALLADLAQDEDSRSWVAENPSCPPNLLMELSAYEDCLQNLVGNPSCPPDLLAQFADDEDYGFAVAENPSCPPEFLTQMASSEDFRSTLVAGNPSCPPELLVQLADDEQFRSRVAGNPSCPPELLTELATDEECRREVASNPSCPPELLAELADDEQFRSRVAGNPSCPPELLTELATDDGCRASVAGNPSCPPDLLEELAAEPQ